MPNKDLQTIEIWDKDTSPQDWKHEAHGNETKGGRAGLKKALESKAPNNK